MKSLAIIGSQWGDEGKGKITDLLGMSCDLVVRYQGGNNAGHTIIVGEKKIVLHLIPSGILHDRCRSVIGHGVVVEPGAFWEELKDIERAGISVTPEKLRISSHCCVVTEYHKLMDRARENSDSVKIGTTQKGIGPAYEDKIARRGIKIKDLADKNLIAEKLRQTLCEREVLFKHLYSVNFPPLEKEVQRLSELGKKMEPFLGDSFGEIERARERGETVLYEGAQGILLDIDYGIYPFVTSSHTGLGGIFTGAAGGGISVCPQEVIGVTKAYMTRVGSGPFPTELFEKTGELLQSRGEEWGATTGRQRRCGWLDLPLLAYAVKAGGLTSLALTKLDVLAGMRELKVCRAYKGVGGEHIERVFPGMDISTVEPVYQDLSPFDDTFDGDEFSPQLKEYIRIIEEAAKVPVGIIAHGPERNEVKFMWDYFKKA